MASQATNRLFVICLLEQDAPEVDEADALFMTGACSAFVSHLTNKARLVGLLT
jgi:hypothetical protein